MLFSVKKILTVIEREKRTTLCPLSKSCLNKVGKSKPRIINQLRTDKFYFTKYSKINRKQLKRMADIVLSFASDF